MRKIEGNNDIKKMVNFNNLYKNIYNIFCAQWLILNLFFKILSI